MWSLSTREVDRAHKPEPIHLSYYPALNIHGQKQRLALSHHLIHQMGITVEWCGRSCVNIRCLLRCQDKSQGLELSISLSCII